MLEDPGKRNHRPLLVSGAACHNLLGLEEILVVWRLGSLWAPKHLRTLLLPLLDELLAIREEVRVHRDDLHGRVAGGKAERLETLARLLATQVRDMLVVVFEGFLLASV